MSSFLGPSSTARRLVYSALAHAPEALALPILTGPLRGMRWFIDSGNYSCWLGSYEMIKQAAFAEELSPGAVVFDVGAHVGFYSLLSATLVKPGGMVYAFEPLKRNVAWLRRHVAINHLNVEIIEAAVADTNGRAPFHVGQNSYTGSLQGNGEDVDVVSIDSLYLAGRLAPPRMIKIDVEGGEQLVLRGAEATIRATRPVIFLAIHGAKANDDCMKLLQTFGYQVAELADKSIKPDTEFIVRPLRDPWREIAVNPRQPLIRERIMYPWSPSH